MPYMIPPENVEIYALIDPRNDKVKYVGVAANAAKRHKTHISEGKSGIYNRKKREWIAELLKEGLIPALRVLETVPFQDAESRESFWIDFFSQSGCDLTNAAVVISKSRRKEKAFQELQSENNRLKERIRELEVLLEQYQMNDSVCSYEPRAYRARAGRKVGGRPRKVREEGEDD